ncbi:hypothetical protein H1R20_g263, partial [Candolleomyces eurysporus]
MPACMIGIAAPQAMVTDGRVVMSDPDFEARRKAVQEYVKPDDPLSWDVAWKKGVTPWDDGIVEPSLMEVIEESGIPFPREGKALVPGCGAGYEAFWLAKRGLKATGMDISETAIEAANRERNKYPQEIIDNSQFLEVNFFDIKDISDEERYDLAIDHRQVFFVAIPPSLRNDWGRQMAAFVKPGGYLINIIFPIVPPVEGGPPYTVRPDHYDGPLGENFEKIYDEVPTKSSPTHEGKERVQVWRRK